MKRRELVLQVCANIRHYFRKTANMNVYFVNGYEENGLQFFVQFQGYKSDIIHVDEWVIQAETSDGTDLKLFLHLHERIANIYIPQNQEDNA